LFPAPKRHNFTSDNSSNKSINIKKFKVMAKVNSLVSLVLMSIVTAVRFTISQLAAFNRVTSIGGGLMGYNYYPR
jgi:hypothetical protein